MGRKTNEGWLVTAFRASAFLPPCGQHFKKKGLLVNVLFTCLLNCTDFFLRLCKPKMEKETRPSAFHACWLGPGQPTSVSSGPPWSPDIFWDLEHSASPPPVKLYSKSSDSSHEGWCSADIGSSRRGGSYCQLRVKLALVLWHWNS